MIHLIGESKIHVRPRAQVRQKIAVINDVAPDGIELHDSLIHQQGMAAVRHPEGKTVVLFAGSSRERPDDVAFLQDVSRRLGPEAVGVENGFPIKVELVGTSPSRSSKPPKKSAPAEALAPTYCERRFCRSARICLVGVFQNARRLVASFADFGPILFGLNPSSKN